MKLLKVKSRIMKLVALEQSRFIVVGILNTLIGMTAMFVAYNVFHLGYWVSSALDYIIGSIFSYFANKYFTFKSEKKSGMEIVRFAINIVICYLLAYSIAKPIIVMLMKEMKLLLSMSVIEQISMLFGMCIFVVLNYFGQKFFVFRSGKRKK